MRKSIKQLLSVVLVIAMIATLLVVPAAAATGDIGTEWAPGSVEGLTFAGNAKDRGDYLVGSAAGDNITVPVNAACDVEVTYCYKANGTIGVGSNTVAFSTSSGSTNTLETQTYTCAGAGDVTISILGETYINKITLKPATTTPKLEVDKKEVIVTVGATDSSITATLSNAQGKTVTWDAYEVDEDVAVVSDVAVTDGAVTFKGAKVGATAITVKATVDGVVYTKDVDIYVKPATIGDVKEGTYDFTGDNGKTTFLTTADITISSGWKYHGTEHGLTNSGADTIDVKIPADKKANVTLITCRYGGSGITSTSGELSQDRVQEGDDGNGNPVYANTYTLTGVTGTANFTAPASSSVYIHGLTVELLDATAATMSVSNGSVSMRAGTSKDVTVTASGYADTMKPYAVSADEAVATAAVADNTVTITGVAEGKTNVYVVMADTQPTLAEALANDSVKAVAVTVTPALAAGTKEWIWGGEGHDATTFEKDSEGLKMPSLKAVKYHNSYGILANPVKAEDGVTIEEEAKIGIPVEGPSIVTVYTGYTWDISLGDAQDPARYGSALATSDSGKEQPQVFHYFGGKGYVTLTANGSASTYIHGIKVEPDPDVTTSPKVVVWDLFGTQLDETLFDNRLDVETINGFYGDPVPEPPTLGSFATADGEFAFEAEKKPDGSDRNDYRLRTEKEGLLVHSTNNYTKNNVAVGDDPYDTTLETYGGSFQSNGGVMTFKFKAEAGDKLTFTYADASTAGAVVDMNYLDAADAGAVTKTLSKVGEGNGSVASVYVAASGTQTFTNFIKEDGTWSKVGVARFYRETPTKAVISGNLTVASDVPEGYKLIATDDVSGVEYEATVTDGAYSVEVNNYLSGTTFTLSTVGVDGVIVGAGAEVTVAPGVEAVTNDVAVIKVDLVTVTGSVTGLGDALADLVLDVTIPQGKIYVPKIVPAADGAYTAKLERGEVYTLTAKNVNDYDLGVTTLKYDDDATGVALPFAPKTVYAITLDTDPVGVDLSKATITFTNFKETDDKHPDGYIYTFTGAADIKLRDGQYKVKVVGAPYSPKIISDLKVNGAAVTKTIGFVAVAPTKWVFTKDAFTADVVAAKEFNFLKLDGAVAREEKDHAIMKDTGKMSIPVSGPCRINVTVYYESAAAIGPEAMPIVLVEGDPAYHTTGSTQTFVYEYTGGEGYVDLTATGTTYVISIEIVTATEYKDTLYVGADKEFKTVQSAVDAVAKMERPNNERVTIMIDPGDYEEMIWVKTPNITFKNAAANPSIKLKDKGVHTEDGAVRITWYYGCGFDYYSMGANSKFNAEQFAVNKENGYVSHPNSAGGGSNNECWWNATTVIAATGFQAEDIIFENSFNQYVSAAAAADVIVPNGGAKEDSSKPRASLPLGSTEVQRKAYVERAAAIALANDKASDAFFDHCAFVGHQDVIYGGRGVKAGFYDCDVMGACDYIFGPMTAVFAKCDMILNVGADNDVNDVAYITAPQNGAGVHGYLMYNCSVRNVEPGVESAGTEKSGVQHAFGRAWGGATAECIFYETLVGTNAKGESLIGPAGWNTGLGSSTLCAEYHTHDEAANVDYSQRIFGGVLTGPALADGTPIFYRTWMDGWNPFGAKDMKIEGCPEYTFVAADKTALDAAITDVDAYLASLDVEVLPAGTTPDTVAAGKKFVTQDVADALAKALADAKEAQADPNYSQAEQALLDAVTKALTDAKAAFQAGIQTGTNENAGADKAALSAAIDAAKGVYAIGDDVKVVPAGTNASAVTRGQKFVTQDAVDALAKAIADAEAVLADASATQEEIAAAVAALNAAVKTFQDAIKTGTKGSGGGGGSSSSSSSSATTTTKTNANGQTVKKTVGRNGDVVYTVTDKNGEVTAKVELPASIPALAKKFKDVPENHWAEKSINDLAALGMVKGVADEIYDMASPVTRGSVATILFRLAQAKGVAADFSDVAEGAWYADAVGWAAKYGVVTGFEDGTFKADATITREQLAVMLYRFANLLALDTKTTGDLKDFTDAEGVSDWAKDAMTWAVGTGIIKGNGAKALNATDAASRAETACMVDRFISMLK